MKTRHHYAFGDRLQDKFQGGALNESNWEVLRLDEMEGPFSLEKNAEDYEKNCEKSIEYKEVAGKIYRLLASEDITVQKIISLGVGKGALEWHLKKMMPKCIVECTDYTAKSIKQLKKVFRDVDAAYSFDILKGDYTRLDTNAVFIMHRISTEFCLQEWYSIFENMYNAEVFNIIFVPAELARACDMMREKVGHIKNIIRGRKDMQCGWMYSESEFLKMFKGRGGNTLYTIKNKVYHNGTAIFLLERN